MTAWLQENNITHKALSPAGDWIGISVPVEDANALFDADFAVFTHAATGKNIVRTLSYSLPADLKEHIDLVHPTVSFPSLHGGRPTVSTPVSVVPEPKSSNITADAVPSSCKTTVTPACLQALYNIPTAAATAGNIEIAVSGQSPSVDMPWSLG